MNGYWLGKHLSKEHKEKLKISHKGQHSSPDTEFKLGHTPWNKGKELHYSTTLNQRHPRVQYSLPDLSDIQIGYIAGILDGEGCICFKKVHKRKNGSFYYVINVSIGQKTSNLLEIIKKWLNLPNTVLHRNNGCYYLEFSAQNQVKIILKAIEPFLIVKKEKAQKAIAYLEGKTN